MSKINLPIIYTFNPSFQVWNERIPTIEERIQHNEQYGNFFAPNVRLSSTPLFDIDNYYDAAIFVANNLGYKYLIDDYVENILNTSSTFQCWRNNMPSITPQVILDHQCRHGYIYSNNKVPEVDDEINKIDVGLSHGQYLFHGGLLPFGENNSFITTLPLSTSFIPHLAYIEAMHGNKIYENQAIWLYVLKVVNPQTNVFVYRQKGRSTMKYEKEVLFASGATLTKTSTTRIRETTSQYGSNMPKITIPIYVAEVEIS